jgi:hypothetical protein
MGEIVREGDVKLGRRLRVRKEKERGEKRGGVRLRPVGLVGHLGWPSCLPSSFFNLFYFLFCFLICFISFAF